MAQPGAKEVFREILPQLVGPDGDLGDMQESLPLLSELLAPVAAPGFECVMQPRPPTQAQVYPGVEGLTAAWRDYGEAFETVTGRLEDVRESENEIVLLVEQVGKTRHGGVEITQPSAMLVAFEEDAVKRIEFHLDRELALSRAGLSS